MHSYLCFVLFKWIINHLNNNWACKCEKTYACLLFAQPGHWLEQLTRLGLLGSAHPYGSSWTQQKKKRVRSLVFFVYLFLWLFRVHIYIYIYIYMSKKIFSCVLHTTNTLTYFEHFSFYIYKNKYSKLKKMCFSMDFLNIKIIFLHLEFYNMFVKLQRVLANIPKNTKILFSRNSTLFTIYIWIKKSQRD